MGWFTRKRTGINTVTGEDYAREEGMAAAAEIKQDMLNLVKGIIRDLAKKQQFITADHVHQVLESIGYTSADLGNAAGSMFRGHPDVSKLPGLSVKSKRAGRHRSTIGIYQSFTYKGAYSSLPGFIKEYNDEAKGASA